MLSENRPRQTFGNAWTYAGVSAVIKQMHAILTISRIVSVVMIMTACTHECIIGQSKWFDVVEHEKLVT